uniref:protein ecdysoneless homolog n=1 Tax=Styela clava TaxID=7725 RepID=UPI00193A5F01|nr:protein ecdysoneless homolog [Styela clava]
MNQYLLNGLNEEIPESLKTLSLEVVKYEIFILQESDETSSEELEDYRIKCLALVTSLTSQYIWNNEGFNLSIGQIDGIKCLHGETDFGDFIEDEWLIVWILFKITETFPKLAARIRDTDGEFLLIEAADYLPKWLNIDTSKNRVFIHGCHMHIVPQPKSPGEIAKLPVGQPTLKQSLFAICKHPGLTKANLKISETIHKRIERFPHKAKQYIQNVNVFIPERIVKILDHEPNLISAAVRAFYYRDPIDLRSCRVFKHFLPDTRVWSQIPMNRCSYAQLMQQLFYADKRSGYFVPKNVGCDFKGMDLGSKIAHGFEILCGNCSNEDQNIDTNFNELGFQKYIEALKKRDYFDGEIEGSKRYKELFSNAKIYFTNFSNSENPNDSIYTSLGKKILNIEHDVSSEEVKTNKFRISSARTELPQEDSDEWMYLDDEKMDDVLSEMSRGFQKLGRRNLGRKNGEEMELNDLCEQMQNFVHSFSGYEGVECPSNSDTVKFDATNFEAALKRLADQRDNGESLDSSSDDFLSSEEEDDSAQSDHGENLEEEKEIQDAMLQMDNELASTNVGKSFVREDRTIDKSDETSKNDELAPVNIDLNLVENFLKSFEGETELTGPTSTLLQSMGLNVNVSD